MDGRRRDRGIDDCPLLVYSALNDNLALHTGTAQQYWIVGRRDSYWGEFCMRERGTRKENSSQDGDSKTSSQEYLCGAIHSNLPLPSGCPENGLKSTSPKDFP